MGAEYIIITKEDEIRKLEKKCCPKCGREVQFLKCDYGHKEGDYKLCYYECVSCSAKFKTKEKEKIIDVKKAANIGRLRKGFCLKCKKRRKLQVVGDDKEVYIECPKCGWSFHIMRTDIPQHLK